MTNEKPVNQSEVPGAEAKVVEKLNQIRQLCLKGYKSVEENQKDWQAVYRITNYTLDFLAGASWAVGEKWMDNSISNTQLTIGRLEVNCFDEDSEMSLRVGNSRYQSLSVDEAKELANFIISHIKNETDANPTNKERMTTQKKEV